MSDIEYSSKRDASRIHAETIELIAKIPKVDSDSSFLVSPTNKEIYRELKKEWDHTLPGSAEEQGVQDVMDKYEPQLKINKEKSELAE